MFFALVVVNSGYCGNANRYKQRLARWPVRTLSLFHHLTAESFVFAASEIKLWAFDDCLVMYCLVSLTKEIQILMRSY